jgi:hypothetical protein
MTGPIEAVTNRPRLAGIANVAAQKSLALVNPSMVKSTHKSGVVPWVLRSSPRFRRLRSLQAALLWAAKRAQWLRCRVRRCLRQLELLRRPAPRSAWSTWSAPARPAAARSNAMNAQMGAASAGYLPDLRLAMVVLKRWYRRCCVIVNALMRRRPRSMVRLRERLQARLAAAWAESSCQWSSGLAQLALGPDSPAAAKADRPARGAAICLKLAW